LAYYFSEHVSTSCILNPQFTTLYTNPTIYKITDSGGEEIEGFFYEQELQKTSQKMYRIERMIKWKGKKALVKWLGYPESQNSWVNLDALERL